MKLILNTLALVLALSLGFVTAAQQAEEVEPDPVAEQAQTEVASSRFLQTVAFAGIVLVGVGALALASYTAHQAAQGIPLPAFVELAKVIVNSGRDFVLPIGADIANKTETKLDDFAIRELARASGWEVKEVEGKIVLSKPSEALK